MSKIKRDNRIWFSLFAGLAVLSVIGTSGLWTNNGARIGEPRHRTMILPKLLPQPVTQDSLSGMVEREKTQDLAQRMKLFTEPASEPVLALQEEIITRFAPENKQTTPPTEQSDFENPSAKTILAALVVARAIEDPEYCVGHEELSSLCALGEERRDAAQQDAAPEPVEASSTEAKHRKNPLYTITDSTSPLKTKGPTIPEIVAASINCEADEVSRLLAEGQHADARDEKGDTALMWAVKRRCIPVAKLLIAQGADVNAEALNGFTPYIWARLYRDESAEKLLRDAGADTTRGIYWWRNDSDVKTAWIDRSLGYVCTHRQCPK